MGLGGLAVTELIHASRDWWRPEGAASLLQGSGPNAAAVFAIAFTVMAGRYPYRQTIPPDPASRAVMDRWFWSVLALAGLGLVLWEVAQLRGRLVFDPVDLWATGAGVLLAAGAYLFFRPQGGGGSQGAGACRPGNVAGEKTSRGRHGPRQ